MSDLQKIFDIVYAGLKSQEFKQSTILGVGCLYRGPYGLKCAAGWLIDDEDYDEGLESIACMNEEVSSVIEKSCERRGVAFDIKDIKFIQELQNAHDCSVGDMEERLKNVASQYELDCE